MNCSDEYEVQVDGIDRQEWQGIFNRFADANIYQSWHYEGACHPKSKISRLVLRRGGDVVAATQVRIVELPIIRRGVAYILWGPLWRRAGCVEERDHLRQCLREIRKEYVMRRKLAVRIRSGSIFEDSEKVEQILTGEGFYLLDNRPIQRTIMMDLRPSLDDIYKGLHQSWRRSLNKARKADQSLLIGEDDALFVRFETLYLAMLARKGFVSHTKVRAFRYLQKQLPKEEKMTVILCQTGGAGAVISSLGDTGLYLFGASNGVGLNDNSSYLVHWRAVEILKDRQCQNYNLNGVNPGTNPGGYRFKNGLGGKHGREIRYPRQVETATVGLSRILTRIGFRILGDLRCWFSGAGSHEKPPA